jgi:hypothetical protein
MKFVVLLFLACVACVAASSAAKEPVFSDNACVVIKSNPSAAFDLTSINPTSDGSPRHIYTDFHEALKSCPFDPVLIEFAVDLKIDASVPLIYNQSKDLIVRGLFKEGRPTIKGFVNLEVLQPGVSVTFEHFEMDGEDASGGVFAGRCANTRGICTPCLADNDLRINFMVFRNYVGEKVVCHLSRNEVVTDIENSTFMGISGRAISVSTEGGFSIKNNHFYSKGDSVYVNTARGEASFWGNIYHRQ